MSLDEDSLDQIKRESDQVLSLYQNGWNLVKDTATEDACKDWIESLNEELSHPLLGPTKRALQVLRREVAVRLVELKNRAQVA